MGLWDSYAEGVSAGQQLNNNLYIQPMVQQSMQQQLAAQQMANADAQMTLQEKQRILAEQAGARKAAMEAQATPAVPATTTTTTNGGYTPVPQQPTSWQQLVGAPSDPRFPAGTNSPLDDLLNSDPQTQAAAASTPGTVEKPTADLNYTPAPQQPGPIEQAQAKAAAPQTTTAADGTTTTVSGSADSPDGQTTTVTTPAIPGKAANPLAAQIQYYEQVDPQKAIELKSQIMKQASELTMTTGNMQDGVNLMNHAFGTNFTAAKAAHYQILKNGDQPVGILDEGKMATLTQQGVPMDQAYKQSFTPIQVGGSFGAFAAAVSAMPADQRTANNILQLGGAMNISDKVVKDVVEMNQKERSEDMAQKRLDASNNKFLAAMENGNRKFAQMMEMQYKRFAANQGDPEDIEAMGHLLATGKMDASARLQGTAQGRKVIAAAVRENPNYDPAMTGAQIKNLNNLVKVKGMVEANEIDANKNFDQLVQLHAKLGNGMIPAVNEAMNRIKDGMGAPEPGTAAGVAYEALTQYARVINKSTGGQSVTDTARKEANNLLPILRLNNAQFASRVNQYRITMKNTTASQDQAIANARGGAVSAPGSQTGTTGIPSAIQTKVAGGLREGQNFTFTFHGMTYSGKRQGGKLVFD